MSTILLREAKSAEDVRFLWDMLYEAAAVSPTIRTLGREESLKHPDLRKYLSGWGRQGDYALLAVDAITQKRVGAAWYRIFTKDDPGYGYIADDIPELAMAVVAENRGQGIGKKLLAALIGSARAASYKALSLSVDKNNKAYRLYTSFGFADVDPKSMDISATMKLAL